MFVLHTCILMYEFLYIMCLLDTVNRCNSPEHISMVLEAMEGDDDAEAGVTSNAGTYIK